MEKFIIALNKNDKKELDENNFKFIADEIMSNKVVYIYEKVVYIYENDINLLDKLEDKSKFLFSSLLFI